MNTGTYDRRCAPVCRFESFTTGFYEKVEKVKGRRGGHPYYFFRDA